VTDAQSTPLPVRVEAAWKNTTSGFAVEMALPQGLIVNRLRILQRNADAQSAVTEVRTPAFAIYRVSARLPGELSALLPEDVRGRVVDVRGWGLSSEGNVRRDATQDEVVSWRRWLYRALLNAADIAPMIEPSNPLRDDSPERVSASAGQGGAEWRRDPQGTQLVLTTAVPIRAAGNVRAVLLLERSNAEALLLADRAVVHLLGLTVLAFLASAGLAFLFATQLSGRIRRLRDAAEQALGRTGEVRRFPVSSARDEIGDLSRSFSRLLDEIAAYTDYLRSLASKLSHELHTPLAIVRSSLDNLDLAAMPAEARPYLARARDGVERMGSLVRTMSEATRIEHAISAAEHERFDLARLLADVAEGYRPMLAPRSLLVEGTEAPLLFDGAPDLIVQALDKLVDNARGFTPAEGRIVIALRRTAREAVLEVSNTGPALPEAMRHRLFDSLVSLRERARSTDGSVHLGFGLHVVKLVAAAHGGSAEAENLKDGSGALFRLRLPLR
jgi:signal transduction histidine kinase